MVEIRTAKPPLGYCPTCGLEGHVTSDEIGISKGSVAAGKCPVCTQAIKTSKATYFVYKEEEKSTEIVIRKKDPQTKVSEDATKFKKEIEEVQNIIKTVDINKKEKEEDIRLEYVNNLLSAAQLGLVFNNVTEGEDELDTLKKDMVSENEGYIKEKYNSEAYKFACIIGGISAVLGILLLFIFKKQNLHPYFFVITGTMMGMMIRLYYWGLKFDYKSLKKYTKNKVKPVARLIIMGIASFALLLFLKEKILAINFFNLDAKEILAQISLQFTFGILVGILGDIIVITLCEQVPKLFKSQNKEEKE